MKDEYRIVKGSIKNLKSNEEVNIIFALGKSKNGVYYFDVYISDESFRDSYYKNEELIRYNHELRGLTEDNSKIYVNNLSIVNLKSSANSKIRYRCNGYIEIKEEEKIPRDEIQGKRENEKLIKFIELEGLDLLLSDHTFIDTYRNGQKVKKFFNFKQDHYKSTLICNSIDQVTNHFELEFTKNSDNNNIILEFKYKENNSLLLSSYYQIRNNLLSLLSFANNGIVHVRRELFGELTSENGMGYIDSNEKRIYSFNKLSKPLNNHYLSIGRNVAGPNNTLNNLLNNCVDNFISQNELLDFSSAINNLINAEQVALEERYYILITVLEKIASNYANSSEYAEKNEVIDNEIFLELKDSFLEILEDYKNKISNTNNYNDFRSRLMNINRINRNGTKTKLQRLFEYAEVELSEKILSLIEVERNSAVHEGKFGNTYQEKVSNYYVLDHAIRDIILNLIQYKGRRIKRI